ncbi:MAG: hypothetical protein RL609_1965, partial [Bacteroidota bacterium]
MKKIFFILFHALLLPFLTFSQAPSAIPYQAVVRNVDGSVMSNASLMITLMIHDVTATGTVVFEESHTTSSNAQGLININVGSGAASVGSFNAIDWGSSAKFLHVQLDAGNGLIDMGTQQLMSVPYALHASKIQV